MRVFGKLNGLAYGLLGLPLAFVALPLYVILPNYYAKEFGVPLAILGAIYWVRGCVMPSLIHCWGGSATICSNALLMRCCKLEWWRL